MTPIFGISDANMHDLINLAGSIVSILSPFLVTGAIWFSHYVKSKKDAAALEAQQAAQQKQQQKLDENTEITKDVRAKMEDVQEKVNGQAEKREKVISNQAEQIAQLGSDKVQTQILGAVRNAVSEEIKRAVVPVPVVLPTPIPTPAPRDPNQRTRSSDSQVNIEVKP